MEPPPPEHVQRPLTPREEAVLVALIKRGDSMSEDIVITDDDRTRWLAQAPHTQAGSRCDYGTCPSIELTGPSGATPQWEDTRVVLEAGATGALLLLFIDDDQPSYLELAPLDEHTSFQDFPEADALTFSAR